MCEKFATSAELDSLPGDICHLRYSGVIFCCSKLGLKHCLYTLAVIFITVEIHQFVSCNFSPINGNKCLVA